MLCVLQIMIEKIRNSNQEAFITLIDYSKAFDSVIHHHLFETILQMGFPRHLVSLIAGLYQDQKATIRWNGDHCEYFDIKKGVRQGCILSLQSLQFIHRNGHERIGYRWHGHWVSKLEAEISQISDMLTTQKGWWKQNLSSRNVVLQKTASC